VQVIIKSINTKERFTQAPKHVEGRLLGHSSAKLYLLVGILMIIQLHILQCASGVPRNFFSGGGSTNSAEDRGQREWGSEGGNPLVRSSGGSCILVQEISFHIVKFS
jgi:hypothetical protein